MTDEELQAIRDRAEKATPGPWVYTQFPFEKYSDALNDQSKMLAQGISPVCYGATTPGTVGDPEYCTPAFTGNGPTSAPNADFIAHARTDIPKLLDEIERLNNRLLLADELVQERNRLSYDVCNQKQELAVYKKALELRCLDRCEKMMDPAGYWLDKAREEIAKEQAE